MEKKKKKLYKQFIGIHQSLKPAGLGMANLQITIALRAQRGVGGEMNVDIKGKDMAASSPPGLPRCHPA